jgi:Protein of unknown function (DUF2637)
MSSTDTTHPTDQRSRLTRAAWPLVVGAALAISWWSLYTLASERYGMPPYLAAVVSTVYDGGALVLADLTQRYARTTDSGAAPRALMLALIGTSAWLNYQHATMLHYSLPGQVMFASPPVIAGALFEVEQRFAHREALRVNGRVSPALPAFGRYAWLLHPARTVARIWQITASRVDSVPVNVMDMYPRPDQAATEVEPAPELVAAEVEPEPVPEAAPVPEQVPDEVESDSDLLIGAQPPAWSGLTAAAAVQRIDAILPGPRRAPADLVKLLAEVGVTTTEPYVRTVRSRASSRRRPAEEQSAEQDQDSNVYQFEAPHQEQAASA